MIQSEQDIYLQETEIKPNRYATLVLIFCVFTVILCFLLTEIGVFRVGKTEMRVGTVLSFLASAIPLTLLVVNPKAGASRKTKYFVVSAASVFTMSVGTLLTFHTTIMLLFPILFAMLYRSRKVGILAASSSLFCTVFSPILGYLLNTWDIELFKELILIGTNGTAEIVGGCPGHSWVNIGKIILYLVFPRLLMVGSCSLLMFYVIQIGGKHVENQILLHKISRKDALTQLFNQNYFKELMGKASAEGKAAILFFDVNGLKAVNDSMGHEIGDLLLRRCALSILNVCDERTTYGFRLGGDEFIMVMENAGEEDVLKKISDWKMELSEINRENREQDLDICCSMAVGYAIGFLKDIENLTKTADENMYRCKMEMKSEMKA